MPPFEPVLDYPNKPTTAWLKTFDLNKAKYMIFIAFESESSRHYRWTRTALVCHAYRWLFIRFI